jgi:hypothetical protein
MPELYKFENLLKFLEEHGFVIKDLAEFELIDVDFEKIVKEGKVSFKNGFINYIDDKNKLHPGYCYKKVYPVNSIKQEKPWTNPFPRKHICECKTIKEFIEKGKFQGNFHFLTSLTCEVIDKDTGEVYEDIELNICKNCLDKLINEMNIPKDEIDFFIKNLFKKIKKDNDKSKIKTDIFGYSINWKKLSNKRREEEHYTCKECGFKASNFFERQFIDVHHKDRNKINNEKDNLIVLCAECHSKIDDIHKKNFSSGVNKIRVEQLQEIKRNKQESQTKDKTKSKTTYKQKRNKKNNNKDNTQTLFDL